MNEIVTSLAIIAPIAIVVVAIAIVILFPLRLFACLDSEQAKANMRKYWLWWTLSFALSCLICFRPLMTVIHGAEDYRVKGKILQNLSDTSSVARTGVVNYWEQHHSFPQSNVEANLAAANTFNSKLIESVTVTAKGTIIVKFNSSDVLPDKVKNTSLRFIPRIANKQVLWDCFRTDFPEKYQPKGCKLEQNASQSSSLTVLWNSLVDFGSF